MGELPLPAIIGWLVLERLGGYDAEAKLAGRMQQIPPDQAAEAETFRGLLRSQPEAEVRLMFRQRLLDLVPEANAAILDREATFFFNRPSALPVYQYWARMPLWSIDEASALTLDRDPRVVNRQSFEEEGVAATPFAVSFRNLGNLIDRSVLAGLLDNPLEPSLYLGWCKQIGLTPPPDLVAEVEALRGTLVDWKDAYWRLSEVHHGALNDNQAWADAYDQLANERDSIVRQLTETQAFAMQTLQQLDAERAEHAGEIAAFKVEYAGTSEKGLATKEQASVLKLLIAAVMDCHGYDPTAARSPIPNQLVAATERFGVPLSDETVRKYLKMAAEFLPPEAKITAA